MRAQDVSKVASWISIGRRTRGIWALLFVVGVFWRLVGSENSFSDYTFVAAMSCALVYVVLAWFCTDYSETYYVARILAWGSLSYFYWEIARQKPDSPFIVYATYFAIAMFVGVVAHTISRLFLGNADPVKMFARTSRTAKDPRLAGRQFSDERLQKLAHLQDPQKIGITAAWTALVLAGKAALRVLAIPAALYFLIYVENEFSIPTFSLVYEQDCIQPEPTTAEKAAKWFDERIKKNIGESYNPKIAKKLAPSCEEVEPSTIQKTAGIVLGFLLLALIMHALFLLGELLVALGNFLYASLPTPLSKLRRKQRRPVVYLRPFGMDGYGVVSNRSWFWIVGPFIYPLIILLFVFWAASSLTHALLGDWLAQWFPWLAGTITIIIAVWFLGSLLIENAYGIVQWIRLSTGKKIRSLESNLGRTIARFTDFVGIGDPKELGTPSFGGAATRAYFPNENWKEAASILMEQARCIVVFIDGDPRSSGIKWEMEQILQNDYLSKTVFILPHDPGASMARELLTATEHNIEDEKTLPNGSLALHVAEDGGVNLITSKNGRQPDYEIALLLLLAKSFGTQEADA